MIIILALGCYIVYDKVINNNTNTNTSINTETVKDNANEKTESNTIQSTNVSTTVYNHKVSKRTIVQAVREGYIEVLIDTAGNAYLYTIGNIDVEKDSQLKNNIQNIQKQFKNYSPKGYKNNFDDSTELSAYKLNATGVLTAYYVHMGNGGLGYFVFVKENGKLSYLSYDKLISNGEISLKDISNLENVVSIVENTYTMTPYAININGDEISLNNYIK